MAGGSGEQSHERDGGQEGECGQRVLRESGAEGVGVAEEGGSQEVTKACCGGDGGDVAVEFGPEDFEDQEDTACGGTEGCCDACGGTGTDKGAQVASGQAEELSGLASGDGSELDHGAFRTDGAAEGEDKTAGNDVQEANEADFSGVGATAMENFKDLPNTAEAGFRAEVEPEADAKEAEGGDADDEEWALRGPGEENLVEVVGDEVEPDGSEASQNTGKKCGPQQTVDSGSWGVTGVHVRKGSVPECWLGDVGV